MPAFVIRVWLPDRPGALGSVASRIGAVRADVVGIDIIERGAGRGVDELTVDLPDGTLVDLLVAEINQVDGVDIESIRSLEGRPPDPAVAALDVARRVTDQVAAASPGFEALLDGAQRLLGADWAAVVDADAPHVVALAGSGAPSEAWLCAFVAGATTEGAPVDLADLALSKLSGSELSLVVARRHSPLRGREQEVLDGLAALC